MRIAVFTDSFCPELGAARTPSRRSRSRAAAEYIPADAGLLAEPNAPDDFARKLEMVRTQSL